MNKKVLIGGGIAALVIGAIAGLYVYTKKSIGKIAAAIDDTFDIEMQMNVQPKYDKAENQEKTETKKFKIPEYSTYDCVAIDHSIEDDIDLLKKNVDELWTKYDELFNYQSYINTINLFDGDDGK